MTQSIFLTIENELFLLQLWRAWRQWTSIVEAAKLAIAKFLPYFQRQTRSRVLIHHFQTWKAFAVERKSHRQLMRRILARFANRELSSAFNPDLDKNRIFFPPNSLDDFCNKELISRNPCSF